ncbi:hypothetical protein CERSUDRAFT_124585 [Gelatoporia subvermispora B]|uniref:Uncharacterized protein n=1 Tax=Ceriporiopsis subvermispora (strain B) TaxID=914234 RepID=M2RCE3_CERS8|nr:hypothetical protein CERSUDRAFT_124585 [Gelatoporia subvermispora B]
MLFTLAIAGVLSIMGIFAPLAITFLPGTWLHALECASPTFAIAVKDIAVEVSRARRDVGLYIAGISMDDITLLDDLATQSYAIAHPVHYTFGSSVATPDWSRTPNATLQSVYGVQGNGSDFWAAPSTSEPHIPAGVIAFSGLLAIGATVAIASMTLYKLSRPLSQSRCSQGEPEQVVWQTKHFKVSVIHSHGIDGLTSHPVMVTGRQGAKIRTQVIAMPVLPAPPADLRSGVQRSHTGSPYTTAALQMDQPHQVESSSVAVVQDQNATAIATPASIDTVVLGSALLIEADIIPPMQNDAPPALSRSGSVSEKPRSVDSSMSTIQKEHQGNEVLTEASSRLDQSATSDAQDRDVTTMEDSESASTLEPTITTSTYSSINSVNDNQDANEEVSISVSDAMSDNSDVILDVDVPSQAMSLPSSPLPSTHDSFSVSTSNVNSDHHHKDSKSLEAASSVKADLSSPSGEPHEVPEVCTVSGTNSNEYVYVSGSLFIGPAGNEHQADPDNEFSALTEWSPSTSSLDLASLTIDRPSRSSPRRLSLSAQVERMVFRSDVIHSCTANELPGSFSAPAPPVLDTSPEPSTSSLPNEDTHIDSASPSSIDPTGSPALTPAPADLLDESETASVPLISEYEDVQRPELEPESEASPADDTMPLLDDDPETPIQGLQDSIHAPKPTPPVRRYDVAPAEQGLMHSIHAPRLIDANATTEHSGAQPSSSESAQSTTPAHSADRPNWAQAPSTSSLQDHTEPGGRDQERDRRGRGGASSNRKGNRGTRKKGRR